MSQSDTPNKFSSARSPEGDKRYLEQDVFEQPLESTDDFLLSPKRRKDIVFPGNNSFIHRLPVEAPSHLIRRAVLELESGSLNELLIYKLSSLDRNSGEFRDEYVRLRVASWLQSRAATNPYLQMGAAFDNNQEKITQQGHNFKDPWTVNTPWDLFIFFGPLLTLIIASQFIYSYELGALAKKHDMLPGNLSSNMGALIIFLVSLFTTSLILYRRKGQDHKNFIQPLRGLGIASSVIAIASFLLLKFLPA